MMAKAKIRRGLRGQSALVRSQFKRSSPNAKDKFRRQAMALARTALSNAILWIDKKETRWALSEVKRAACILEVTPQ